MASKELVLMAKRADIMKRFAQVRARGKARQERPARLPGGKALERLIEKQKKVGKKFLVNYLKLDINGKRKREKAAISRIGTASRKLALGQKQLGEAKTSEQRNDAVREIRAQKRELVFYYGIFEAMRLKKPSELHRLLAENKTVNLMEELREQIFS